MNYSRYLFTIVTAIMFSMANPLKTLKPIDLLPIIDTGMSAMALGITVSDKFMKPSNLLIEAAFMPSGGIVIVPKKRP